MRYVLMVRAVLPYLHTDARQIEHLLDGFAAQFRQTQSHLDECSTRQKALALLSWVRAQNLTGMEQPIANYRNIRNCLIGQALQDPDHPSLPIISTAIYCSLAKRIGLNAGCCAFPTHVHAVVFAPPAETLNGRPSNRPPNEDEKMFLDPYGSDDEVTVTQLRARLVELGWAVGSDLFLGPSPTSVIVQRTAQNLRASWSRGRDGPGADEIRRLRNGDPELNLDSVLYGAMWAQLMMTPTRAAHWDEILERLLDRFVRNFSEDAWLVERWLLPRYDAFVAAHPLGGHRFGWQDARLTLGMVRNLDMRPPTTSRRYTRDLVERVRYRVGQVFRHARYQYIGIINGWAPDVNALPTPVAMDAEEALDPRELIPRGSGSGYDEAGSRPSVPQIFYTCL
jgi:F-box protein 21